MICFLTTTFDEFKLNPECTATVEAVILKRQLRPSHGSCRSKVGFLYLEPCFRAQSRAEQSKAKQGFLGSLLLARGGLTALQIRRAGIKGGHMITADWHLEERSLFYRAYDYAHRSFLDFSGFRLAFPESFGTYTAKSRPYPSGFSEHCSHVDMNSLRVRVCSETCLAQFSTNPTLLHSSERNPKVTVVG